MSDVSSALSAHPAIRRIGTGDLRSALKRGLRDFLRAPLFGLFFSAVYVAGGLVLYLVFTAAGREWWLIPFAVGFPILAPFATVGLYEVSRRIEQDAPLSWSAVLGVVFHQKDRQMPSMAVVILLVFLFWLFVAHTIFALFMGLSAMTNVSNSLGFLLSGNGPVMLLVGGLVGAGFAGLLFSVTVIGLPLLLDKELDFVTAMILSVSAVLTSPGTMILWAGVIAGLLFAGMAPMFLGLFIVLPVLGHATWHLYRRVAQDADGAQRK